MTKQQAISKTEAFVRQVLEKDLKQRNVTAKTVRGAAEKIIKELPLAAKRVA
jgi:hypothetical protein